MLSLLSGFCSWLGSPLSPFIEKDNGPCLQDRAGHRAQGVSLALTFESWVWRDWALFTRVR